MNLLKPTTFLTCLALSMLLTACSSHIPAEIKQAVEDAPDIQKIHLDPNQYIGRKVRWGGTILQIENKQDTSWLSIVGFPLNSYGRPLQSGESTGRFIAIIDEFLEPKIYTSDRQITFGGTFVKTESRKVGEFSYDYPVIKVEHYYLWPVVTTPNTNHPPYWWYDPWYYPAHPYHLRP
jgi:outer membrane lipoprotein